jgi:hypothetical protein
MCVCWDILYCFTTGAHYLRPDIKQEGGRRRLIVCQFRIPRNLTEDVFTRNPNTGVPGIAHKPVQQSTSTPPRTIFLSSRATTLPGNALPVHAGLLSAEIPSHEFFPHGNSNLQPLALWWDILYSFTTHAQHQR